MPGAQVRRFAAGSPIAEPYQVEPDFADGLLDVEDHGDVVWLIWFRNHIIGYGESVAEHLIERRVCRITVLGKSVWNALMTDLKNGNCVGSAGMMAN